jgi:CubicO group peptidase (beta-lactamase class C family)
MKHVKRIILVILILLCKQLGFGQITKGISGQSNNVKLDSTFKTYIDSLINSYLEKNHIPGMALALVTDTSTLYMRGYGLVSADQKESITINSAFDIASNTKLFTATALMQLYKKGLVALDSPLVRYIPYFKMKGPFQQITLRHLLTHTSGMVEHMNEKEETKQCCDSKTCLDNHIRSLHKSKLLSKPGEKYSYSNVGYTILAEVVSKVSKLSYEDYVKENILEPLAMNSSSFECTQIANKVAHHKIRNSKAVVIKNDTKNSAANGAAGLFSSIHDMSIWAKVFLANGPYLDKYIVQDSTFQMMLSSGAKTGYDCNGCFSDVGLGWHTGSLDGNIFVGHGGTAYYGGKSHYLLWPKQSLAIVLLSNASNGNDVALAVLIMQALIEYINTYK